MEKCSIFPLTFLFSCVLLIQCQFIINQRVEYNVVKESLPLILKFLNDDVKATIIYNSGKIMHTQLKGDILEVDLLASITCKSANDQCSYDSAECRGLLYVPPNAELQVLSVDCNPNLPVMEEPLALPVQVQTCTGCLTDVNVNADGVQHLVKSIIQHVEAEQNRRYTLVEVLRAQQQVINGVNFVLTVKIAPALCNVDTMECMRDPKEEDIYCIVKFYQEPGYQKPKNIISNNCTKSQAFIPTFSKFESNDVNKVGPDTEGNIIHEKDASWKKSERTENDILKDVMSQIIPLDKFESTSKKYIELVQSNPVKSIESSSVHNMVDDNGQPIIVSSTFQEVLATEDQPISLGTDTAVDQAFTVNNASPSSTVLGEEGSASPINPILSTEKSIIQQKENDDIVSHSVGISEKSSATPVTDREVNDQIRLDRLPRSVVNSEKFTHEEKASIQEIADFVASTLDLIDDDNYKRVVLQIINAKKIRSGGLFLNMNLRIGISKCGENENSENCKKNLLDDLTKFCKVQVSINEDFKNPKVVKSHCENERRNPQKSNRTSSERHKRSLVGGKQKLSLRDPKVNQYLGEAVNYMNRKLSDGDTQLEITKVLSASSQVVSGMSYDFKVEMSNSCYENSINPCKNTAKICDVNVWDQPWMNSRIITINCGGSKISFNALEPLYRSKRSLLGGWSPSPIVNPKIIHHLKKLLTKLDSQSGKDNKLKVKEIISASSQVVAGTNWDIKAKIALSDCSKSDEKLIENCGDDKDKFETICEFKFWEKLPDKNGVRELDNVQINCEDPKLNVRSKREVHDTLVGGHNAVSNDDPRIIEHLNKLLPKLDSQSDKEHKFKIEKILSATSQVVAGTNWNIKAVVVLSDCLKSEEKKSVECGKNENSFKTTCNFKFWEKLPNKDGVRELGNIQMNCDEPNLNYRSKRDVYEKRRVEAHSHPSKRSVPGGWSSSSVDNPKITHHLKKLLTKLDAQSGKDNKLKVKEIISASSQVVAGTNWDIKAKVALSDCSKSDGKDIENCGDDKDKFETICEFKFWEKLPDKNGVRELDNIQVNCEDPKLNVRSKREVHDTLVGGHNAVSNDDPRIIEHLNKLLPKLDSQSDKQHKLKIKKILSATSQVVAGTNWNIKAEVVLSDCLKSNEKKINECGENENSFETTCKFKFWEKLPNKDGVREFESIQLSCDEPKLNYRSKRDVGQLIGGHSPLSNDDPRILKHLSSMLPQLDSQSGKEHKLKIKEIISATSQVVAGTNWIIKARVALSDCAKSEDKKPEDCGENQDNFESICTFKFWERLPDKNGIRTRDNINVNCDNQPKLNFRSKRDIELVGGEHEVDKGEPLIYDFLSKSLQHIDLNSPEENKFKVKEILSATRQVVAGDLWKIKVSLVLSDCSKNDITDWDQCGELQGAPTKICVVKVWDRPWIKQGRETNITCENQRHEYTFRTKRSHVERPILGQDDHDAHFAAFRDFEQKYNKQYSTYKERIYRFGVFLENMKYVKLLNENEQGTAVYGPTQFADITRKEFSKKLGYRSDLKAENEIDFLQAEIPDIQLPDSFDWREKNAVAAVKNQGSCGSCWAFSVTGNVEGQYAIKNGELLEFSEQELVDCDTVDEGCNGGLMDNAYRQIEKLGGLEQEKDYPYDGEDEQCHFNKNLTRVQLSGAVNISTDETEMAKWLVKNGPISIAINANAMQFYMGGVSHPYKFLCNPKNLDHGVLIVGYGVHTYPKFKKSLPFWIVKNSWGKSWGEQGYYRVYRGDGTCGVNQTPSSAILK